jgi:hypothetical protein
LPACGVFEPLSVANLGGEAAALLLNFGQGFRAFPES